MGNMNKRYTETAGTISRVGFVRRGLSGQMEHCPRLRIGRSLCALIIIFLISTCMAAAQDTSTEQIKVHIYSVEPHKLVGVSRLKKEPFTNVRIIDLSVIAEMDAMFNAYINDETKQLSVAKMKTSVAQLPRHRLQKLADAQLALFDLQTRYDITIDDLPVVVLEHKQSFYLYKGNDAYEGFLLWQQSRK